MDTLGARTDPVIARIHAVTDNWVQPAEGERAQRRAQMVQSAWRHVSEYLLMFAVSVERWEARGDRWVASAQARFEKFTATPGTHEFTDEELAEEDVWGRETLELRLDEEVVYLVGNILLDRLALAVKHTLFGGSAPLSRHSQLATSLTQLAEAARLPHAPSSRLLELARRLEDELSEKVRDKTIVHAKRPGEVRTGFGRSFNLNSGETSLQPFVVYPKNEREMEPAQPLPTRQLVGEVFEYALELVTWVQANDVGVSAEQPP